jgi:hypothetical protein
VTETLRVQQKQADTIDHLEKGRDPVYFFEKVLGIRVNHAQKRWLDLIRPGEDGWQWRHKMVIHVAANQIGKTLGVAGLILWACNYKTGVKTEDPEEWLRATYLWIHVAPKQQQAYLPLKDIRLLIRGNHPAQVLKYNLPDGFVKEVRVEQYYDGLEFWNGAIVQFRTSEDKAQALQGYRCSGISFDEVGFEDHLKAVVYETLMMRLISTGGPILLVGTPNGLTEYYEFVRDIVDQGREVGERQWVKDDSALCWSHVSDNVGFGITQQEIDRMEENLDPTTKEQQLRGAFLEPAEAFFIPTEKMLAVFDKDMAESELPVRGHRYVIFWDPSVAADPTAVVVLDVGVKPWKGVYFKHYGKPAAFNQLIGDIYALHALYNSDGAIAITGFDATSMGGAVVRQSLANLHPQRPMNFGGPSTKVTSLMNLKAAITEKKIIIPSSWARLQRELLNYRLKDDKIQQDAVMALVGATDIASKGFSGSQKSSFSVNGRITAPAWR